MYSNSVVVCTTIYKMYICIGLPTATVQIQPGRREFKESVYSSFKTQTILRQNNVSELSVSRVLIIYCLTPEYFSAQTVFQ